MNIRKSYIVPTTTTPIRLNNFLEETMDELSRKGVKKAIKRGEILLDGNSADGGTFLSTGQRIDWIESARQARVYERQIEVVFEDPFMAIVNKPAGLAVSGNRFRCLARALPFNLSKSNEADFLANPLPVHRLDALTSGLVVVAKTHKASVHLSKMFEKQEVSKTYQCIVHGQAPMECCAEMPLEGKQAKTVFTLLATAQDRFYGSYSHLKVKPITGRTHQIRKHLQALGHPILGDQRYGSSAGRRSKVYLTATKIVFHHPQTKEKCSFEIECPRKFNRFIRNTYPPLQ